MSDIKENRKVLGGLLPLCSDGAASYIEVLEEIRHSGREHDLQDAIRSCIFANYSEQSVAHNLVKALTVF